MNLSVNRVVMPMMALNKQVKARNVAFKGDSGIPGGTASLLIKLVDREEKLDNLKFQIAAKGKLTDEVKAEIETLQQELKDIKNTLKNMEETV